ncbi:NlpC/P60 family protein [Azospirillum halopraeferens]|uniref:C40 family peptidase n=1 Tax=Azospirillum halopraeferens TaxID=34010 RepID=UPI00040DA8DC|nr:NlpC/P60 family protein [Azospirillum halopraeferens]
MSDTPDPRRHPVRQDLAAAHLRGRVTVPRFVEGEEHRVTAGTAGMRADPAATARQTSQVLYGEGFTVYDRRHGWAWGQCATDGYVGWVPAAALAPGAPRPTHVVTALAGFRFPEPDLKVPPLDTLPLGAAVCAVGERNGYLELADGGWIYARHLAPAGTVEPDPVATAERLLGVPYLWGGRTPHGIDCSGLAQLALLRAGIPCPRDSDMQRDEVGEPVPVEGPYRRADLVFFPGHVGLMLDGERLLHATAFTMTVTVEPLVAVAERVDPTRAKGLLGVRRVTG